MSKTFQIDRSKALSLDIFTFAKSDNWQIRGSGPSLAIKPDKPGTWFFFKGIYVSCPNCGCIAFLHPSVTKIDKLGKLSPDFICPSRYGKTGRRCDFHRSSFLDKWSTGKRLYACAGIQDGKPVIIYTHAASQQEARRELGTLLSSIQAIAPAIGFVVNDKDGKLLSDRPLTKEEIEQTKKETGLILTDLK